MIKRIVSVVKHNTIRNGKKTPLYWSISEDINNINILEEDGCFSDDIIDTTWLDRKIPKKIKEILELSDIDITNYGLKRGEFILTLKNIDEDGEFSFDDIISLNKV